MLPQLLREVERAWNLRETLDEPFKLIINFGSGDKEYKVQTDFGDSATKKLLNNFKDIKPNEIAKRRE